MQVAFLITTYNRSEACRKLIEKLSGQGDIFLINDGSKNYFWVNDYKVVYYKNKQNFGKAGYYQTVSTLWQMAGYDYDYYFMLPDDMLPVDNFMEKALTTWQGIQDERKICMNILVEKSRIDKPNWTGITPIEFDNYRKVGWVDMAFMSERGFFEVFGCSIPNPGIDYVQNPETSSGVGSYISRELVKQDYTMYQTKTSLLVPQPEAYESQMNAWRTNQEINHVII